jgi:large-conductance mechanosensitive channel
MYERVIKNVLTTLVGLLILAFCGYVVVKAMNNGESLTEVSTSVSGWLTTALIFLRAKNSLLPFYEEKKQDGNADSENQN